MMIYDGRRRVIEEGVIIRVIMTEGRVIITQ